MAALVSVAAAVAFGFAAGCGSAVSSDRQHEQEITGWTPPGSGVVCTGGGCSVTATETFGSLAEAWFLALPIVAWVETNPKLRPVSTLRLQLRPANGSRVATFTCLLPHDPPPASGVRHIVVSDIEQFCGAVFR